MLDQTAVVEYADQRGIPGNAHHPLIGRFPAGPNADGAGAPLHLAGVAEGTLDLERASHEFKRGAFQRGFQRAPRWDDELLRIAGEKDELAAAGKPMISVQSINLIVPREHQAAGDDEFTLSFAGETAVEAQFRAFGFDVLTTSDWVLKRTLPKRKNSMPVDKCENFLRTVAGRPF